MYEKVPSHFDAGTIIWTILQTVYNLSTDTVLLKKDYSGDICITMHSSRIKYNKIVASLAIEVEPI